MAASMSLSLTRVTPDAVTHSYLSFRLSGPYDAVDGKASEADVDYVLHHRYYYDVPEFQTILRGDDQTGFNVGYYRDGPHDLPSFVASNEESKGCKLTVLGDNVFAAIFNCLKKTDKSKKFSQLMKNLESVMREKRYSSSTTSTDKLKQRSKRVVSRGFPGVGLVVPVDENGVGWRELPYSTGELKSMFSNIVESDEPTRSLDDLQEMITYVQFANDECDYGQGLELGQDLFCYGHETLHRYVKSLLPLAYTLLRYDTFKDIITAHLDKRVKGGENSYLK